MRSVKLFSLEQTETLKNQTPQYVTQYVTVVLSGPTLVLMPLSDLVREHLNILFLSLISVRRDDIKKKWTSSEMDLWSISIQFE